MTWTKLKEKIEDHIVTIVFALITFLCLVIWQTVPSESWIQLGAVVPKRSLAALAGLLLIGLVTTIAYVFSLRRELKNIHAGSQSKEQTNHSSQHVKPDIYVPDEKDKEILRYLFQSNTDQTFDDINRRLGFKYKEELNYYLNRLSKYGYTYTLPIIIAGQSLTYLLSDKGREYVMYKLLESHRDV